MAALEYPLPLKTLVIVCQPNFMDPRDLIEIGQEILREAKDIDVNIVGSGEGTEAVRAEKWSRPSLTVSFARSSSFVPVRGPIFQNKPVEKLDQHNRFMSAGIPTPKTEQLGASSRYLEDDWGEFVVLKPLPLGRTSKGDFVKLMRTRRLDALVRLRPVAEFWPEGAPLLVQKFIDTGSLPTSWRLLTLFGRTLYSMKFWSPLERPELASDDALVESAIIDPKHPDVKKKYQTKEIRALEHKPAILEFASRICSAFPDIPLQGIDVLEEQGTGKLYALEINGGGNTWHFSSPYSIPSRQGGITREDRMAQFDAWKIAAAALIDASRRFAG